jgi:hypothetical protein
MVFHFITTGPAAIAKIDVLRVHAAELYVAPAVGEFFDCKRWYYQTEGIFSGRWADVERAHAMLAMIRSAMEREFAEFLDDIAGCGEDRKSLAANFSKGMGHRISERLRRLKCGRALVLARGEQLATMLTRSFQSTLRLIRRSTPSGDSIAYAAGVEAGDRLNLMRLQRQQRLLRRAARSLGHPVDAP